MGSIMIACCTYGAFTYTPSPPPILTVIDGERGAPDIIRDAETGCQYLRASYGVTVPRLGPDGRPMCGRPTQGEHP